MTNVTASIRSVVSGNKKRFQEDGFNLDLTSKNIEGLYRNHIDHVVKFLEQRHPGSYRIWNLCSEKSKQYSDPRLEGRVLRCPFKDHNPPPLALMRPFCVEVTDWLAASAGNVAVIHCKAGKGRTGVMICAYLVHAGLCPTAEDALRLYGERRTHDSRGVTIASQIRYVKYYDAILRESKWSHSHSEIHPAKFELNELILSGFHEPSSNLSLVINNPANKYNSIQDGEISFSGHDNDASDSSPSSSYSGEHIPTKIHSSVSSGVDELKSQFLNAARSLSNNLTGASVSETNSSSSLRLNNHVQAHTQPGTSVAHKNIRREKITIDLSRYTNHVHNHSHNHNSRTGLVSPSAHANVHLSSGHESIRLHAPANENHKHGGHMHAERSPSPVTTLHSNNHKSVPDDLSYTFESGIVLSGDVRMELVANHILKKKEHLFQVWFNSNFIKPLSVHPSLSPPTHRTNGTIRPATDPHSSYQNSHQLNDGIPLNSSTALQYNNTYLNHNGNIYSSANPDSNTAEVRYYLDFHREDLDRVAKDKNHKLFTSDFKVRLIFRRCDIHDHLSHAPLSSEMTPAEESTKPSPNGFNNQTMDNSNPNDTHNDHLHTSILNVLGHKEQESINLSPMSNSHSSDKCRLDMAAVTGSDTDNRVIPQGEKEAMVVEAVGEKTQNKDASADSTSSTSNDDTTDESDSDNSVASGCTHALTSSSTASAPPSATTAVVLQL